VSGRKKVVSSCKSDFCIACI